MRLRTRSIAMARSRQCCVCLLALLASATWVSISSAQQQQQVNITSNQMLLQIHGSGDESVHYEIDKIINLFESRTKPKVYVTFRGAGTAAAQAEFMGPPDAPASRSYNDYGVGNIPLSAEQYTNLSQAGATPLQLPWLLAKVAFFSTLPPTATGSQGLFLSPCTLAKIYNGQITMWNDPAILADNPTLVLPSPAPPIKAYRVAGPNGATRAITTYLNATCPSAWTAGVTPNLDGLVPPSIIGMSYAKAILSALNYSSSSSSAFSWALGYGIAQNAVRMGLREVMIQTPAGTRLNSTMVNSSALVASLANGGYPAVDADWSAAGLNAKAASAWPMTIVSYLYVRKDVSFLGMAGGLLRAFIQMLLSDDIQTVLSDMGLMPLHTSMVTDLRSQLEAKLQLHPSAPVFTWEESTAIQPVAGQADYVVSDMRTRFETTELWGNEAFLTAGLAALQERMIDVILNLSAAQQTRDQLYEATQNNAHNAATIAKVQEIAIAGVVLAVLIALVALIVGAVYISKTKAIDVKYSRIITDWMPGRHDAPGHHARSGFVGTSNVGF